MSRITSAAKIAATAANSIVNAALQSIIDNYTPYNDPSGRSAMIIGDMNLQLDATQKTGKLTPELRNQIMFGACTALLDTGSAEIQGMHGEMQLMLGQGTTIEDMILKKQYSKSELNEYFDWYYAGNAVERDRSKELVQESIDTYYGSDKQYEQEQLIQILESQYKGEIAGTMAIFLLSFTPFDEIIDAIQVGNDLAHGDVGGAMLDGIGFIPIVEGFKYIDDLAGLIKSGKKITVVLENGSEVTATIKNLQKALEQLPSGTRILDESGNVIGEIGKHVDEIAEGGLGVAQDMLKTKSASLWATLEDGTNQGVKHFNNYWEQYPERIPSIANRLGVDPSEYSNTVAGFENFTKAAQNVMANPNQVRTIGEKTLYFVEGAENANKGVTVIVQGGKLQSMMPTTLKDFLKLK